ncbi:MULTISPECIES: IclR family transcriptional regulator [Halorussus]|uniref:IclR family transcriptional regulator n=1 Tax=Halorussus TaxID=1070314 RepID=UPI0020A0AE39|nr:IclR family transcriptional regulator [Halorussus vallis]USZ77798.1 IclR family transcriptional regulator [Halorussus vallis]
MGEQHGGGRTVKSDGTLFSIVEQLRASDGAGVTELANRLDVAKSTVHDHLSTIRDRGFVVKRGNEYHLGLEFFNYGQYVRNQFELYEAAKPIIDELAETTGEMVWLVVHENGQVMYLYGCAGQTDIDENTLIGSWAYMHSNSAGKAILAHLPDAELEYVLERHGLPQRTPNTITDRDELEAELEAVRERGYALNLGEDLKGIHAVSVPLLFEDRIRGAIAIAGPAHRMTRERCETELIEQLSALTNDIELSLAYG